MQYEIILNNTTDLLRFSALDVMAIDADRNYCTIIMNDGEEKLVLFQLGQLEDIINHQLGEDAEMFIRVGRGLIVNREYLYAINLPKQELTQRSTMGKKVCFNASKESLKQLKMYIYDEFQERRTK